MVGIANSVVKFIVNVRLVENKANSTVGKVMVVNDMIHISIPGITLAIANKACPSKPSHEFESRSLGPMPKAEGA